MIEYFTMKKFMQDFTEEKEMFISNKFSTLDKIESYCLIKIFFIGVEFSYTYKLFLFFALLSS